MKLIFKAYSWWVIGLVMAVGVLGLSLKTNFAQAATPSAPAKKTTEPPLTPPTLKDYFNIPLSAAEIKAAGFAEPVALAPTKTRFLPPVYYFRVKDIPANGAGAPWGDAQSVASVMIRPVADKKWVYNTGDVKLYDLGGRFEARVSSPGYYLVVTGPDKDKTVALLRNLKVLY